MEDLTGESRTGGPRTDCSGIVIVPGNNCLVGPAAPSMDNETERASRETPKFIVGAGEIWDSVAVWRLLA